MIIAVAVPPFEDFYRTGHRMTHLGARTAAACLSKEGHNVPLFCFPSEKEKATVSLPADLRYLKPLLIPGETGPLSWFRNWTRFGPDYPVCAERILAENPDRIILSLFAFCYGHGAIRLAEEIRKRSGVPVFLAGAGSAVYPEYFLRHPAVDSVLTGEAETGGYGLAEKPVVVIGIGREAPAVRHVSLTLSRGCPKQCRFCSNHLTQGRVFRLADPESVIRAVGQLPQDDKRLHINFEDDNLLLAKDCFIRLVDELSGQWPGTTFSAENGLDYTMMDPPLVERLSARGFTQFNWSAGSFDPQRLKGENRFYDPDRLSALEETARASGIPSILYFIAGLEGDTAGSIVRSLAELTRRPSLCGISPFYAVPGLPGFEKLTRFDTISPSLCCGSALYPWNGSLTTGQLYTAFRLARVVNLRKTPEGNSHVLVKILRKEKRLFTLKKDSEKPVEIPFQDREMVLAFLDATD